MGITIFKVFIWGNILSDIYGEKSHFTAPLPRRSITKFLTIYPTIYLPNENFEYIYPLKIMGFIASKPVFVVCKQQRRRPVCVFDLIQFNFLILFYYLMLNQIFPGRSTKIFRILHKNDEKNICIPVADLSLDHACIYHI